MKMIKWGCFLRIFNDIGISHLLCLSKRQYKDVQSGYLSRIIFLILQFSRFSSVRMYSHNEEKNDFLNEFTSMRLKCTAELPDRGKYVLE